MPKVTLNLEDAILQAMKLKSSETKQSMRELVNDAPAMSMAESFERLSEKKIIPPELGQNLKKAVGFRNLSVHAYDKIDWQLVWNILEEDLKDLVRFLECVESFDG